MRDLFVRALFIAILVESAHCIARGPEITHSPEQRLLRQRPQTGRVVETALGFMVPYQQPIPGTSVAIEMVPIPGGSLSLQPLPRHPGEPDLEPMTVQIEPFWIGKYEITMEQYMPYRELYYQQRKDQNQGVNQVESVFDTDAVTGPTEVYDVSFNFEFAGSLKSPAPSSSQFATRQYTKFLSRLTSQTYRLPLHSEWQHACLAESESSYSFGDDAELLGDYAVFHRNFDEKHPLQIGLKKPNRWGLCDMHGNVSEFVIDDSRRRGLRYGHVACGGNAFSNAEDCTAKSLIRTTREWWDEDPDFPPSPWWMTSDDARMTGFRIVSPLREMSPEQKSIAWDPDSERLKEDVVIRVEEGRGSVGSVSPYKSTTRVIDGPR